MENTRYDKPRRFALRLDQSIDFREVTRWDFQYNYEIYQKGVSVFDEGFTLAQLIMSDPTSRVLTGQFEDSDVIRVAEDHNDDVDKIPKVSYSNTSYRSKIRKISGRFIDTLEAALEIGHDSLKPVKFSLRDDRFGWMLSEIDRREELLEMWKESVGRIERSFD
jgi:hypothetical protein